MRVSRTAWNYLHVDTCDKWVSSCCNSCLVLVLKVCLYLSCAWCCALALAGSSAYMLALALPICYVVLCAAHSQSPYLWRLASAAYQFDTACSCAECVPVARNRSGLSVRSTQLFASSSSVMLLGCAGACNLTVPTFCYCHQGTHKHGSHTKHGSSSHSCACQAAPQQLCRATGWCVGKQRATASSNSGGSVGVQPPCCQEGYSVAQCPAVQTAQHCCGYRRQHSALVSQLTAQAACAVTGWAWQDMDRGRLCCACVACVVGHVCLLCALHACI